MTGIGLVLAGTVAATSSALDVWVEPRTGIEFVALRGGSYIVGSPPSESGRHLDEVEHEVTIGAGVYLGRTEVSVAQWSALMAEPTGSDCAGSDWTACPVVQVNYHDVERFIARLSTAHPELTFRLPSEAEWEVACRAGTTTPYATGSVIDTDQANFDGRFPADSQPLGERRDGPSAVGSYAPNPWGLHDLHGNVWEWCSDTYGPYRDGALVDPAGVENGPRRVLRGGSWRFDAAAARCAARYHHAEEDCGSSIGFRVAMEQRTE